jgi:hypothetical protein
MTGKEAKKELTENPIGISILSQKTQDFHLGYNFILF